MSPFDITGRVAALAYTFSPALAADVTMGDVVVHQPWSRVTPGGAQVGDCLTVENRGSALDRLTGGTFAASTGFELHITFTGSKLGLKKGEAVAGTLTFERSGITKVDVAVEGIAAREPGEGTAPAHAGQFMPGMDIG